MRVASIIACVTLLLASHAVAQDAARYTLQPGDQIEVTVLEDPALNRTALIRPDGRITLPLAGSVAAAGRSPEDLAATIRSALGRDFVEPPTVTVSLVGLGEAPAAAAEALGRVFILGEVARPGQYDVPLPMTALQALAISGGPGPFAARSRIQIRRSGGREPQVLIFDYDQVEDGATPIGAVEIRDGDVIVVPERNLFE